jgi:hypothetical protein
MFFSFGGFFRISFWEQVAVQGLWRILYSLVARGGKGSSPEGGRFTIED